MQAKRIASKFFVFFLALMLFFQTSLPVFAQESYTGTINKDKVFFRTRPNTNCDYLAMLNKKTKVAVLGISGEFYHVRYDGKDGYVMRSLVNLPDSALKKLDKNNQIISNSKYAKTASIKALGKAPAAVKYGSSGEDVEKLQRALQLKKCYDGVVDGKFGNMTREALKNYQRKNKLSVTGKADYSTIKSIFGAVSETTPKDDPKMQGITSISQIPVPNTTKKNASGKHVVALQQALKLKGCYLAPIDGKYGDSTVAAVQKYQKSVGLNADGVAGNGTIKKLFGKNAANYTIPTERLDWFNGGSTVIPKGATFTVKDINTGEVFTCRRWSGYNHLDAEPVDADSSAAIKRAAGGAWSWARRPVLVKYNGHVYAGSMNSMPHEDNTISGNNFNGHFCIHFYKSKTHGTNRLDQTHQNAVERAMQCSW